LVSKDLNAVLEQVAQCCAGLDLEGRARILGVSGLDAGVNASFTRALKTYLAAAGTEVAVLHLENNADAAVRADLERSAGKGRLAPADVQRYLDEGIDYDGARASIQEMTGETGILIVEGVFVYTGALSDFFDLRLFLEVDTATARGRLESAKPTVSEAVFDALVAPAFEFYLREYDPAADSDLVIDYTDGRKPRLIATDRVH